MSVRKPFNTIGEFAPWFVFQVDKVSPSPIIRGSLKEISPLSCEYLLTPPYVTDLERNFPFKYKYSTELEGWPETDNNVKFFPAGTI